MKSSPKQVCLHRRHGCREGLQARPTARARAREAKERAREAKVEAKERAREAREAAAAKRLEALESGGAGGGGDWGLPTTADGLPEAPDLEELEAAADEAQEHARLLRGVGEDDDADGDFDGSDA